MQNSSTHSSPSSRPAPTSSTLHSGDLVVCPACHKPNSPRFVWYFNESAFLCLVCYHHMPADARKKFERSALKGESKTSGYALKAVGILGAAVAVVVTSVCLFYKPHAPLAAEKHTAAAPDKPGARRVVKGGGGVGGGPEADGPKKDDPSKDDNAADGKTSDTIASKDDKKTAGKDTMSVAGAGGKADDKQRMAPTAQALISELPQHKVKPGAAGEAAAPSTVAKIINQANDAAQVMKSSIPTNPAVGAPAQPVSVAEQQKKDEKKNEAEKTKAAALNVATSLIGKHDKDGTKTTEALAKLGQVSTVFAEVATKMTDGVAPAGNNSSSGNGGTGHASKRIEGDVLSAQGRAGYDPEEAVKREMDENGGAGAQKMIRVNGDPQSQQPGGTAAATDAPADRAGAPNTTVRNGTVQPGATAASGGMVQNSTALAMASLPTAFTAAARGQGNGAAGSDGAPEATPANGAVSAANATGAAQLSVLVLSMQGDLLFDFNSAGLRAGAAAELKQVADLLAQHPDLPILVRGYTDSKGTPEANLALSRKRAEAVRDWLVTKSGLKSQNISVQGEGANDPVAANENPDGSDNPAGREKNRRVTVTIPQQQSSAQR